MLTLENIDVYYGAIHALRGVSLTVEQGEVVTLIGANGAGKSTTLRAITGLLTPKKGRVLFEGEDITGIAAHKLVARGISMSPEGRGVFANLTVLENLELGAYPANVRARAADSLRRVFALFPRLRERQGQIAGSLSGGEQQMLAIGRAVMACPSLLILDEPSMGLSPLVVHEMFGLVRTLNRDGVTILLVEQNIHQALQIADDAYVLQTGHVVMRGPGAQLLEDPAIRSAYIGSIG